MRVEDARLAIVLNNTLLFFLELRAEDLPRAGHSSQSGRSQYGKEGVVELYTGGLC